MGFLPFIGVFLFLIDLFFTPFDPTNAEWKKHIVLSGVTYMIGWAGVGAGITHLFFSEKVAKSIGFKSDAFQKEVGFCDLSLGIVGLLAASYSQEFWLAIIFASSFYRIGCGIGHIQDIIKNKNYAINNTAILFIDFVVPGFLIGIYYMLL